VATASNRAHYNEQDDPSGIHNRSNGAQCRRAETLVFLDGSRVRRPNNRSGRWRPREERTALPDIDTAVDWRGRTVIERAGWKLGKLGELYLDQETDRRGWASIKRGSGSC
jgi:hypothetical protein